MNEIMSNKVTKIIFLIILAFILFNVMGYVIAGIFIAGGLYFLLKKHDKFPVVYQDELRKEDDKGVDYYIEELNRMRKKFTN